MRRHAYPLSPVEDRNGWWRCDRCGDTFSERRPTELSTAKECGPVPANSPKRDREGEMCEAAYRCVNPECQRPWIVFAVHGEPTDGVDDPRKCRFCEGGIGRRIR